MDVHADSYPHALLQLLSSIAEADFVSLDLEFTGIPSRLPGKAPWKPRAGSKTLEDRYQETRIAADRYNILQVGLTCARFDYQQDKYVLKPYNISLSPLLNPDYKLDIEREIRIQSGAATFLLNHGFDLGAAFSRGVQYLSRRDANDALERVVQRLDKKPQVEDMQLKPEHVESLDFVKRAREAINEWSQLRDKNEDVDMLEITTHTGLPNPPQKPTISRFEKRLVHQLVRAEHHEKLVAIGRQDCIRIIPYNQQREEDNKRNIKRRVKEQIAYQTGFRWVFEALAADGDLCDADPQRFSRWGSTPIIAENSADVKSRFDRIHHHLIRHQPVLVGHNMFTDLVYFYRSFVGELPETLAEFRSELHEIFPRIVDTKYLATHAEGDLNASPTLQEISDKLESQPLPNIATHPNHPKYDDTAMFHEAGYDSLLTATILLRLSAKMNVDRQPPDDASDSSSSAAAKQEREHGIQPSPQPELLAVKQKTRKGKKNNKSGTSTAQSRFQTRNAFAQLSINDDDSDDGSETTTSWQNEVYEPDTSGWVPIEQRQREPMEMIPAWNAEFWQSFGNTLRVYGTEESVLKIAPWGPSEPGVGGL